MRSPGSSRDQLLDHGVYRCACFNHNHQLARPFERGDEFFDRLAADEILAGMGGDEVMHGVCRAVVYGYGVAIALHVQYEVLAHHGQAG